MISALAWIPRGAAAEEPQFTSIPNEELQEFEHNAKSRFREVRRFTILLVATS